MLWTFWSLIQRRSSGFPIRHITCFLWSIVLGVPNLSIGKLLMIFWVSCRILWWVWAKLTWIWEGYLQLLHNNIIKQSSYMYVLCPKNHMYSLSYCSECSALGPIICIFWLRRFRRNMKILTMQCHFLPALYDSWVSVDLWYIVWIFGSHFFKFIFIGKWVTDLLHVMVPV